MDFYFTDRQYNVLGVASTGPTSPLRIANETEQQSTDAATVALAGTLYFTKDLLAQARGMADTGNYILYRDDQGNDQFLTILESHLNASTESISFTGDSAGNDLRNETVGEYTATKAMSFADYFKIATGDSGWEIGVNEAAGLTRTLTWDSQESAYERLTSLATEFGMELDFSFTIHGTDIVKRYVNVRKSLGADNDVVLRVGKELNSITIDSDMYDLRTSIVATGGTPDGKDVPITLKGYKWTDKDGRFVLGADGILRDTVAVQMYSRLRSNDNPTPESSHLQRVTTYEATTQATLLQSALADLKKYNHVAVNYTLDIASLPDNVHKGDTIHLEDAELDLHLSGTVLDISKSYSAKNITATIGDYKIEPNKVAASLKNLASDLKANTAKTTQAFSYANQVGETAQQAKTAADNATTTANAAQTTAKDASTKADTAQSTADTAKTTADTANSNANAAKQSAEDAAKQAQVAVQQAQATKDAVDTIQPVVEKAQQDVADAKADAATALASATQSQTDATTAINNAKSAIDNAKKALAASNDNTTALAGKADQTALDTVSGSIETINGNAADALANAKKALETASTASTDAASALTTAGTASTDATTAKASATKAATDAASALTTASTANTKASAAKTTVDGLSDGFDAVKSDTATALANAASALDTAGTANTTATKASKDAATASDTATQASKDAATANSTASTANTTATQASKDAKAAVTTATSASDTATAAQTAVASKADQSALDDLSSLMDTVKDNASTALDNAKSALASATTAATDAASATKAAGTASTTASTAATNASKAATDAASALSMANTASDTATKANTTATAAQKAVAGKADQSSVDGLSSDVDSIQTDLASKADATELDKVKGTVTTNSTNIAANTKAVQLKADQTVVDTINDTVTSQGTTIAANAKAIALKADKSTVDTLNGTVKTQGTSIEANAAAIALKAAQKDVDTISGTVKTQGTAIEANASAIKLKAAQTDVDTVKNTVATQGTAIEANASAIKLKADSSTVDTLAGTVKTQGATIDANKKGIALKADSTTVAAVKKQVDGIQVGGVNMLPNTGDYSGWSVNKGATVDKTTTPAVVHYPLTTRTTGGDNDFLIYTKLNLLPSTTYTLSFNAWGSGILTTYIYPNVGTGASDNHNKLTLSATNTRYVYTFTTLSTVSGDKNVLFRHSGADSNGQLEAYITAVQLEQGSLATSYSEAPQDIQNTVDDQEARLESAEQAITPDAITSTVMGSDDFQGFQADNDADKQSLQDSINGLQDDSQDTITRVTKVEQTAGAVKTTVDTMSGKVDAQGKTIADVQNNMTFDSNGLTLGKSDSTLTVNINNSQMTFKDGGKQVAYINGQKMYISDLQVLNSIKLGYHKIAKYSDDGETTAVTFAGA